ncbi:hypothetical protein BZA05DRAFT_435909 [Tricharina praecox]|uniref:uncharacterized protein n=1 Tax=Tricharina praecox TaxID=43433 RepID=UPI00221F4C1A|nr:uncharacterized protein BZA05DRAFT_435909 [Tricharina praecox]KAI5853530.1 hypothetical protein BZA05DRAFT_435909 [Tricharina praecox]
MLGPVLATCGILAGCCRFGFGLRPDSTRARASPRTHEYVAERGSDDTYRYRRPPPPSTLSSIALYPADPRFLASTDPALLDIGTIHRYISGTSYWARGTPYSVVKRGLQNSLSLGIYDISAPGGGGGGGAGRAGGKLVGSARWITDKATFAYLSDLFVLDEYQGRGLGRWMVDCLMRLPEIQGLRRLMLVTGGADALYEKYAGFNVAPQGGKLTYMEKVVPSEELYGKPIAEIDVGVEGKVKPAAKEAEDRTV